MVEFGKINKVLVAALATAVAVLVAARLAASGDVSLTVWGDRDLCGPCPSPAHWPLFGPESNGGARSPGGAFYLLLAAILAVGRNVATVNVGVVLLFAASVAAHRRLLRPQGIAAGGRLGRRRPGRFGHLGRDAGGVESRLHPDLRDGGDGVRLCLPR